MFYNPSLCEEPTCYLLCMRREVKARSGHQGVCPGGCQVYVIDWDYVWGHAMVLMQRQFRAHYRTVQINKLPYMISINTVEKRMLPYQNKNAISKIGV